MAARHLGQPSVVAGVFSRHFVRPVPRFGNTIYSHGLIKVYNQNIMSDLRIGCGEQNKSKSGVKYENFNKLAIFIT